MAQKLKGVGGVLGSLISSEPNPSPPEPTVKTEEMPSMTQASITDHPAPPPEPRSKPQGRIAARRGRPPGQKTGESADKEKVTLRLSKELIDDYREWSWEERCQLGELVEKAMVQYRKSRSRQKSQ